MFHPKCHKEMLKIKITFAYFKITRSMKFLVAQLNTVMETRGPPKTPQVSPLPWEDTIGITAAPQSCTPVSSPKTNCYNKIHTLPHNQRGTNVTKHHPTLSSTRKDNLLTWRATEDAYWEQNREVKYHGAEQDREFGSLWTLGRAVMPRSVSQEFAF